ncbi:MAG: hypothetical protein IIZ09_01515 [Ruminococcus sp.]|nr:hypothetical protein [Ruminococcus sp.]
MKSRKAVLTAVLAAVVICSAWMICGNTIMMGGFVSYILSAVPIAAVIIAAYRSHIHRGAAVVLIMIYLAAAGLMLLRAVMGGRTLKYDWFDDGYYHVVYEFDPGAMGRMSYEHLTYYSILECDHFSIRVLEDKQRVLSDDGLPRAVE